MTIIKKTRAHPIKTSEITPTGVYLRRRDVLAGLGLGASSVLAGVPRRAYAASDQEPAAPLQGEAWPMNIGDAVTPKEKATTHNNFYELGPEKQLPSENHYFYKPRPWKVRIGGLVNKPGDYDVDELLSWASLQERVYRLRCVEAWSMVIPWLGFPFNELIKKVQPQGGAKYVAFRTFDPNKLFPDEVNNSLPWPYHEGLRMDEAMHDLALLVFGMYGGELLTQNGAPLRMVVPWKYGYKSVKALVAIDFVADQPPTSWNDSQPGEYGFFSNVNPNVRHPRWAQNRERVIGSGFLTKKRDTDMFNGYSEVASLYEGMDLKKFH